MGEGALHFVEPPDVRLFHPHGFWPGVAHGHDGEAVAGEVVHGARLAFLVDVFDQLKIEPVEIITYACEHVSDVADDILVDFAEVFGQAKAGDDGATCDEVDGGNAGAGHGASCGTFQVHGGNSPHEELPGAENSHRSCELVSLTGIVFRPHPANRGRDAYAIGKRKGQSVGWRNRLRVFSAPSESKPYQPLKVKNVGSGVVVFRRGV